MVKKVFVIKSNKLYILMIVVLLPTAPVHISADPFGSGMVRSSFSVGWGQAFDQDYTIVGFGAGMYVVDSLEIGMDGEIWLGNSPFIYKVSPEMRYVLRMNAPLKPYVGVFYRHTAVNTFDDLDSAGGRVGVYFNQGGHLYFGVGIVHEWYLNNDKRQYDYTSQTYPEISLTMAF